MANKRNIAQFFFLLTNQCRASHRTTSIISPPSLFPASLSLVRNLHSSFFLRCANDQPPSSKEDASTRQWLELDHKVNTYPMVRAFTAIGFGGDDFVHAMVVAVESVVQHPIPEEQVSQKLSSKGRYISVNIGPIHVRSTEQYDWHISWMRAKKNVHQLLFSAE